MCSYMLTSYSFILTEIHSDLQVGNRFLHILFLYQVLYMLIGMFVKPFDFPQAPSDKRYAILISARNEENVIGELIHSIRANDYP